MPVAKLQPVVLSGGSGTRLWPLSREKYPKQLLPLIGDDSLLQATVRRTEGIGGTELCSPMVVCNEEYRFVIAEQLRLMGQSGSIVLEHHSNGAITFELEGLVRSGHDSGSITPSRTLTRRATRAEIDVDRAGRPH